MTFISRVLLAMTILASISARADEASNEQLIRFAKAVGIYEQIEEQKNTVQAQGEKTAQQYVQQVFASTPELPDQFKQDMEDEMQVYVSNLASLIDTDFAVDAYIKLISKKLSATDIEKLTEFYESDLGQKFIRSNIAIMNDWTTVFMGDVNQKAMVQLKIFINNLMAKAASYRKEQ